eukprot:6680744-Pyramimonas_sp.AAC.1
MSHYCLRLQARYGPHPAWPPAALLATPHEVYMGMGYPVPATPPAGPPLQPPPPPPTPPSSTVRS